VASDAGIQPGDVILVFGGAPITTISDMQSQLDATSADAGVSAEIRRGPRDFKVLLQF
jgi:S1-C subfamily serine protease